MKCHHSPTLVSNLYPSLLLMFYASPICLSCQDIRFDSFFLSTLPTSKDLFIFGHFDCHYPLWDYTSLTSCEIRFFFWCLSSATVFNCCCCFVAYLMVKHLTFWGISLLLHIFNISWTSQAFPSTSKISYITPIHKSGKLLNSPT